MSVITLHTVSGPAATKTSSLVVSGADWLMSVPLPAHPLSELDKLAATSNSTGDEARNQSASVLGEQALIFDAGDEAYARWVTGKPAGRRTPRSMTRWPASYAAYSRP